MLSNRGIGNKKINRVNVSLTNEMNRKLNRLAVSCELKPTTLAGMLIEMCLNDPIIVSKLQSEFNIHSAYRVIPVNKNGHTEYVMSDKRFS